MLPLLELLDDDPVVRIVRPESSLLPPEFENSAQIAASAPGPGGRLPPINDALREAIQRAALSAGLESVEEELDGAKPSRPGRPRRAA